MTACVFPATADTLVGIEGGGNGMTNELGNEKAEVAVVLVAETTNE